MVGRVIGRRRILAGAGMAALAAPGSIRAQGEATVPSTIGLERAINPFMRARSAEELARLRAGKDNYRG